MNSKHTGRRLLLALIAAAVAAAASPALARAQIDVSIDSVTFTPNPVLPGSNLTFTATVLNPGPGNAANASLTFNPPVGPLPSPRATFVSLIAPGGWSCTTPLSGQIGSSTCSIASMPVGFFTFILTVNIDPATAFPSVATTTITLTAMDDPNTSNNFFFETPPVLAATLRSFTAAPAPSGVSLRWRTASEVQVAGFNVYRERNGRRVRLNAKLIQAANTSAGHVYTFVDRKAPRSGVARYWLQAVDLDGTRRWYGPAIARRTM
jgi:hypothetical protein